MIIIGMFVEFFFMVSGLSGSLYNGSFMFYTPVHSSCKLQLVTCLGLTLVTDCRLLEQYKYMSGIIILLRRVPHMAQHYMLICDSAIVE